MTTAGILPSTGPPPPELRRSYIPANLRPDLPDAREKLLEGQKGRARAASGEAPPVRQPPKKPSAIIYDPGQNGATGPAPSGLPGAGRNLSGTAAITVQVEESRAKAQAATPPEPLTPRADLSAASELSDEDLTEIARLAARDREVRAHETAHTTAGQGYTGAISFEYARGPDGIQYAVGGHVDIDVKPVQGDPSATIAKMQVVQRAALAPARPSGQDRAVAAAAAAQIREAERQLAAARQEALKGAQADEGSSARPAGINLIA